MVKENARNLGKEGMRIESRDFHSLLLVTFSDKKEQHEELLLRFKQVCNNNDAEMWEDFDKKLSMLIQDTSCFLEITDDLREIEELYIKNRKEQEILRNKLRELERSNESVIGFFKRRSRVDKMEDYRVKLLALDTLDASYCTLLDIMPQLIISTELDMVKERKRARYTDAIKTFSQRKMKSLEDSSMFWRSVKEEFDGMTGFGSTVHNLD